MNNDWRVLPLSEVAVVGAGNSAPQKKELFEDGTDLFIRTADVGQIRFGEISDTKDKLNIDGTKKLKKWPAGTILMPKSGASTWLNHRVIMAEDGYVSSHLATIKAKEDVAADRYLLHYLNSVKAQDLIQDHKYPSLKLADIKQIQVPIPSLAKQKEIVGILDRAFADIGQASANSKQNIINAEELFQSKLNQIFSQKTKNCKETTLGDAFDVRDGTHDSPKYHDSGYPLVTSKNLKGGQISFEKIKYICEADFLSINKRSKVDIGDVLFAMIGTIGNPVVVEDEPEFSIKNVALFKVSHEGNGQFLKFFLEYSTPQMKREAKGANQKFVGLGYLRSFPIMLPPAPDQNQIVAELMSVKESVDLIKSCYTSKIDALDELKKSILHQAFTGELI